MKRLFLLTFATIFMGCSTMPATVNVPVVVPCPAPPVFERPRLAIRDIRPESPPAEVGKAYATTLEQLGGYAEYLERLLKGYQK